MSDRHDDAVKQWAAPYVALELPVFGSAAWVKAAPMVRLASAVRAAVAWYEDADPHVLAARFEAEFEAAHLYDEADYASWREVAARVRHCAVEPTHAELLARRAGAT